MKRNCSATRAAHSPARCRAGPAALRPPTAALCFSMRSARCRWRLQSKLLRFVECGELQRVGDNETVKVDVRILAATHQAAGATHPDRHLPRRSLLPAGRLSHSHAGACRSRSRIFPGWSIISCKGWAATRRSSAWTAGALAKLAAHDWPGNVRELEHVLERGVILAGEEPLLTSREIDFGPVVTETSGNVRACSSVKR